MRGRRRTAPTRSRPPRRRQPRPPAGRGHHPRAGPRPLPARRARSRDRSPRLRPALLGFGAEAGDTAPDDLPDARRQPAALQQRGGRPSTVRLPDDGPGLGQVPQDLADEERVAVGLGEQGVTEVSPSSPSSWPAAASIRPAKAASSSPPNVTRSTPVSRWATARSSASGELAVTSPSRNVTRTANEPASRLTMRSRSSCMLGSSAQWRSSSTKTTGEQVASSSRTAANNRCWSPSPASARPRPGREGGARARGAHWGSSADRAGPPRAHPRPLSTVDTGPRPPHHSVRTARSPRWRAPRAPPARTASSSRCPALPTRRRSRRRRRWRP